MTSFLQVIASDENENRRLARKAAVLSQTRVNNKFGSFIESNGPTALDYLQDEIATVVASACEEVGYDDVDGTLATVLADCGKKHNLPDAFKNNQKKDKNEGDDSSKEIADDADDEDEKERFKSSSVHEARKPKMCPFHKDVVDISLAAQDPRAGFDSMAQHWGGPRHCDGEGYEGGKCNFKAPMTTQSYWDERATKAEEKRQQRLEQQEEAETVLTPVTDEAPEQLEDVSPVEDFASEPEGAEVIDFPSNEPSAVGVGYEHAEPLAVAASTKVADDIQALIQKYIAQGVSPEKAAQLAQQQQRIGPLPTGAPNVTGQPTGPSNGSQVFAADGNTDLGAPSPKIDKRLWTPKTVKELPLEGDESRHPTERTDVAAQGYDNSGDLTSIGENKTERVDLPSSDNGGFQSGGEDGSGQGGTWSGKKDLAEPVTAAAHDVDKNELVEIMKSNYDGFLPQIEVQKAVVAHRRA